MRLRAEADHLPVTQALSGERWKSICWTVGLARAAAHEHWHYALSVIAWRLNGRRRSNSGSRRSFIAATRGAASAGR